MDMPSASAARPSSRQIDGLKAQCLRRVMSAHIGGNRSSGDGSTGRSGPVLERRRCQAGEFPERRHPAALPMLTIKLQEYGQHDERPDNSKAVMKSRFASG